MSNLNDLQQLLSGLEHRNKKLPILVKTDIGNEIEMVQKSIVLTHLLRKGIIQGLWITSENEGQFNYNSELFSEIFQLSGKRDVKSTVIACPGCSRSSIDLEYITSQIAYNSINLNTNISKSKKFGIKKMLPNKFSYIESVKTKSAAEEYRLNSAYRPMTIEDLA